MTKHKGAAADVVVSSESHRFGLSDRRLTILVLSACAFCGIATVQHLASIAAVMKRIRRSDAEAAGEKTVEEISIVRPVCGLENFSEETLLSGSLIANDADLLVHVALNGTGVVYVLRDFAAPFIATGQLVPLQKNGCHSRPATQSRVSRRHLAKLNKVLPARRSGLPLVWLFLREMFHGPDFTKCPLMKPKRTLDFGRASKHPATTGNSRLQSQTRIADVLQ